MEPECPIHIDLALFYLRMHETLLELEADIHSGNHRYAKQALFWMLSMETQR